jgi:molecular chaperone GrpE
MPNSRASEAERESASAEQEQEQPQEQERDLAAEVAQMEDRWKRAAADLENYRRRSGRDADRRVAEAGDAMVRDWLDVIDSVENGLRSVEPENPMAPALRAVLDQMEGVLARQGVRRSGQVGETFDPSVHDAISVRDTDEAPDRTVLDVARSGFTRDGRVLRPAQVVVARTPSG